MSATELFRIANRIRDKYSEPERGESWETALPKVTMRALADIVEEVANESLDDD